MNFKIADSTTPLATFQKVHYCESITVPTVLSIMHQQDHNVVIAGVKGQCDSEPTNKRAKRKRERHFSEKPLKI